MDFLKGMVFMALVFTFVLVGLKSCDSEIERNEIKQLQWIEDVNNGRPYTNYGE